MRVISGKFKGKKLFSPENNNVRPTTDRIKETMFNILARVGIEGATVLDLFGGTGALGIEALSRGASKVVFIDRSPDSVKLIKQNLAHVGADQRTYEIYNVDFQFALKKLKDRSFDVIFADPPYAAGIENLIISTISEHNVLAQDGTLMIEHSTDVKFNADAFDIDSRQCGNTTLSFLTYKEAANEQ